MYGAFGSELQDRHVKQSIGHASDQGVEWLCDGALASRHV
jgi:hypothetical protein